MAACAHMLVPDTCCWPFNNQTNPACCCCGGNSSFCLQVVGGGTLEVTLSQFWSSLGSSSLQLELSFHGLLLLGPSGEEAGGGDGLTLEGAAGPTKVRCEPTWGLTGLFVYVYDRYVPAQCVMQVGMRAAATYLGWSWGCHNCCVDNLLCSTLSMPLCCLQKSQMYCPPAVLLVNAGAGGVPPEAAEAEARGQADSAAVQPASC
jgi:hypothetical protein